MTPSEIESLLLPGDCLLYAPQKGSVFGWLIAIKTYHAVSHIEVYTGRGRSVASRDGIGVGGYALRTDTLAYVLRPTGLLDWVSFWKWFRGVNGQKYDWLGLARFVWVGSIGAENNGKMFCSEFAVRAYRALSTPAFSVAEDADAVAPADFLKSPAFTIVATPLSLRSGGIPKAA